MKIKKLSFTLDLAIYPFDVYFSFGQTDEEVIKFLKNRGIEKDDLEVIRFEENGRGKCVLFQIGVAIIRMKTIPVSPDEFSVLHHEITHYVMFLLFTQIHMPHNLDTTEAYCYLTEYITREVYKKLPLFK